jgi:hypothetical protein
MGKPQDGVGEQGFKNLIHLLTAILCVIANVFDCCAKASVNRIENQVIFVIAVKIA